eukprot:TRINITY_DN71222_c0_g1_i1.p1 TRINITY_DN71222_c0_g1~~TRINITY_DN71222_c0_g1_i1.p1  ORF type:complete len:245 (-),score=33.97 TRINITY_DN71222_c0_g1_i1:88-792(-)
MEKGRGRLNDGVRFATLKPNSSDASAHFVELMRATLKHAQEISASVGEAEAVTAHARGVAAAVDASITEEERDRVEKEIKRLSTSLHTSQLTPHVGFQAVDGPHAGGTSARGFVDYQNTAVANPASSAGPSGHHHVPTHSTAAQMTQEIETTVMWVQQLLESVHLVESGTAVEPGSSLLSIVQPRSRHQKDEALQRSLKLFNTKKQEEKEFDEHAVIFRRQAVQAALAARSASS